MNQATMNLTTLEENFINEQFLEEQVCQLLQWNAEDFAVFFYETAIAYLKAYFGEHDDEAISNLSARKEFWRWFKNHWTYRDQVFFESLLLDTCSMSLRLELYRGLHNAEVLACDIYPSSTILGPNFKTIKFQLAC
jgi:hypothetical protein